MQVRDITVAVTGMAQGIAAGVRRAMSPVVFGTDSWVEQVRIRLTAAGGPGPVLAQVCAEVEGRRVRVQQSASDVGEAVMSAGTALRQRIAEVTGPWRPRPWPRAAEASPWFLPVGEARIVRVKTPALVWCSPDTAARTMDAMDYDIHLFVDPATETEAAVYRGGPTGYRLARTVDGGPPSAARDVPWSVRPGSANRLTDDQALDRLDRTRRPHLFYADPETGWGRILYRRFDGHYGLIAPDGAAADQDAETPEVPAR